MTEVQIRYHRPPDRIDVYVQRWVADLSGYRITLLESYPADRPLRVDDRPVLEPGAPALWFTVPDAWHDVGRFHLLDESFTGYYANIIAPPQIDGPVWHIHDLCLDLWVGIDGRTEVLDRDEFDRAVKRGWIDAEAAEGARQELERLQELARAGRWPPALIRDYDLNRARSTLADEA